MSQNGRETEASKMAKGFIVFLALVSIFGMPVSLLLYGVWSWCKYVCCAPLECEEARLELRLANAAKLR